VDSTLNVTVEDTETVLPSVIEVLSSAGLVIARVATTKPTLDDVFLKYAGATRPRGRETEDQTRAGRASR
jgi:ABC-2 type transport system ATP-binding protein